MRLTQVAAAVRFLVEGTRIPPWSFLLNPWVHMPAEGFWSEVHVNA